MGWVLDDGSHEGWAACVAPDGRLSGTSTGQGMLVPGITGSYPRGAMMPDHEVVPDAAMVGWRGACSCGWRGLPWTRVASPAEANASLRRDYVSPDGFADASPHVEEAIHDEWLAHVAPVEATAGVAAAAREYAQAGRRLEKSVAAARTSGATWAEIGKAVGITRQTAHERWSSKESDHNDTGGPDS